MYFSAKEIRLDFIYTIGIHLTGIGLKCAAFFNEKIKLGVEGRSESFSILEGQIHAQDKVFWFHCASLGEYEQGLPVFKILRERYKNHKIVLTFFSPSGYSIRKNAPIADVVVYLPLDTPKNAKKFLDIVNPELTIFVKYDIWPNFLGELKQRKLKSILISAAFRENQSYFKSHGSVLRKALFAFDHIFTQNEVSKDLLQSIGYHNVTMSGDTRFDRVYSQLAQDNKLEFIETFKNNKLCVVAGSTWPEDDELLINFINSDTSKGLKFIIAPHNIKPSQIQKIKDRLSAKTVLFSNMSGNTLMDAKLFILDTIGLLSKVYSYADIAYVGGAMGTTGLHNTLEPAVFGVPLIIGNNHEKFPEAMAMITLGGMFAVSNQEEFNTVLINLITNIEERTISGKRNLDYINNNKGAVNQIMNYLNLHN